MIKVDYHTHNLRCGHAQGRIEDYIKAAILRGLADIGISDHSPIYWLEGDDPLPTLAMAKSELDGYVDEVLSLKKQYEGQIDVRLGLECDYIEGMEDYYRAVLAKYPFDYVIGSVHYVSGRNVYDASRWAGAAAGSQPVMDTFAEYYRLVAKSARSGMFDIIAHATAITAYAPKPIAAAIEPLQDAALQAIADAYVCMEINTSGYRKMTTDPFPTARMVAKAHELGIPLTFSSDSHRPDDVAFASDRVGKLLGEVGVTELATFSARQRVMTPFETPILVV
jgi:histidinol-phosphatase (PHP family)